jgi:hypothetical protein
METVAACLVHTIYITDAFLLRHTLPQKPSLYIIMVMCWSRLSLLVIGALAACNATDFLTAPSPNLAPFSTFPTPFSTLISSPTVANPFPTSVESPRLSPAIFPRPSTQALNPARTRISVNAPNSEPRENNQGRLGLLVLIPIVGLIGAGAAWYYKRYKVAQTKATKESGVESKSAKDHPATQPSEPKEALVDETTSSHSPDLVLDHTTVEPAAAAAPQLAAYATAYLPNNKDQCQSVIGVATATPLVTAVLWDHMIQVPIYKSHHQPSLMHRMKNGPTCLTNLILKKIMQPMSFWIERPCSRVAL